MYCQACGKELSNDAAFCQYCGNKISRKIEYTKTGESNKCPNCGGVISALESKCHYCGYEIVVDIPNSLKVFEKRLNDLMSTPNKKKIFSTELISERTEKIVQLIKNYVIPNNSTDIIDFMILAVTNITPTVYNDFNGNDADAKAICEAWISKYEQAHQKAIMIMGNNQDIDRIQNLYDSKIAMIKKERKKGNFLIWGMIGGMFLFVIIMFALMFFGSK